MPEAEAEVVIVAEDMALVALAARVVVALV
jgi:hypothetical protein